MTEPDDTRVEEVFVRAVNLPRNAQQRYLDEQCGSDATLRSRVEYLLKWDAAAGREFLNQSPVNLTETLPAWREAPGRHIGPYTLLERIGAGGFGEVWTADQRTPLRRRVALKIIKPGMDSKEVLTRFEAERQALAVMDHPHVAKVFDAGQTETGRPYFVMEHVPGLPITDYCDSGRLRIRQRLELFILICQAVQHAHQKGIIHRDLKPSNILVTLVDGKPVPKVIDFGIAKATAAPLTDRTLHTEIGRLMGTPEYMSPEQAGRSALDVDTRTDIYSLGVILYQLLTGTLPFESKTLRDAGYDGIVKIIREKEPPKPSTRLSILLMERANGNDGATSREIAARRGTEFGLLRRQLRGELDWIVMKCLEKDRSRRYETANGLALDVQRHLSGEPVLAASPSRAYRLRKFVVRHRGAVIASALVVGALVTGFSVAFWQAVRAQREADRAEQRARETQQVADFQASQLGNVSPMRMGEALLIDITQRFRTALKLEGIDEPEIESAVAEFERLLANVNFTDIAVTSLQANIIEETLAAIESKFGRQPLVQAQLLQSVASTMVRLSMLEAAVAPQERALEIRRRESGDRHVDTIKSMKATGWLYYKLGRYDDADKLMRETVHAARRVLGETHHVTLNALNDLGVIVHERGKPAEAEPYFRKVIDVGSRVFGEQDAVVITAVGNLAATLGPQGRYVEAEAQYRNAWEVRKRVLGPDDLSTLWAAQGLGTALCRLGRLEEAEPLLRGSVADYRRCCGNNYWRTVVAMHHLGELLRERGELEEAAQVGAEAVRTVEQMHRDARPPWVSLKAHLGYARTLTALRQFDMAEGELRASVKVMEDHHADPSLVGFDLKLAEAHIRLYEEWHSAEPGQGYYAEAAEWRAKLDALRASTQPAAG